MVGTESSKLRSRGRQLRHAQLLGYALMLAPLSVWGCGGGSSGNQKAGAGGGAASSGFGGIGGSGAAGTALAANGGSGGVAAVGGAGNAGSAVQIAGSGGVAGDVAAGAGGAGAGGMSGDGGAAGTSAGAAGTMSQPLPACGSELTLKPGETTESIMVGTQKRTYILHVPAGYDGSTRVPFVIDFHPLFGTGSLEKSNSGYLALSDSENFVVAFPDGINNAWNIGKCCTQSRDVDDLGFAKALADKIKTTGCIDPKRVYADGYSMGGGMSHFLACNAADVFAAVAPSAFDLLTEDEEPCQPARPISVIAFRGTGDTTVPYAGGASNPPNGLPITIHFRGAVATFQHWAELNHCTDTPSDTGGGCQTYKQCQAGVEVTLCTSPGGGHVTGDAKLGWSTLKRFSLP